MARADRRPRGHIEERANGSFRAIVFAGTDPLTGRRRYLKKTAATRREAEAELTRMQTRSTSGATRARRSSVSHAITQWLEAADLVRHAHQQDPRRLPHRLRAWLHAAEAEMHAGPRDEGASMRALDLASAVLPDGSEDVDLPFLMLDRANLTRWRGSCRARLGTNDAVNDLAGALEALNGRGSLRAETGLRADLATALAARGDAGDAVSEARQALRLADRTGSLRQRSRALRLLASLEGVHVQEADERARVQDLPVRDELRRLA